MSSSASLEMKHEDGPKASKSQRSKHHQSGVFSKNAIFNFLKDTPVSDVATLKNSIVTVGIDQSASYVLKTLADNGILSAPVLDANNQCIGFIEANDIISFLLSKLGDKEATEEFLCNLNLDHVSASDVLQVSKRSQFVALLDNSPITMVVELLANGVHRTALFGYNNAAAAKGEQQDNSISVLCSQSDIIRYLDRHGAEKALGAVLNNSLHRMGFADKQVYSISGDAKFIEAMVKMQSTSSSALAVVDADSGKLIDSVSASDLRGLTCDGFADMLLPVGEFLAKYRKVADSKKAAVITGRATDSFRVLVRKMALNKIHQVWVVDAEGKPCGVISMTDIMISILHFRQTEQELQEAREKVIRTVLGTPGNLTVRVVKGENLVAKEITVAEPYVVIHFPLESADKHAQTDMAVDSLNPQWNSTFHYTVDESHHGHNIVFHVWHKHKVSSDDALGYVSVSIDWILDAFGTKSAAVVNFRDSFKLVGPEFGELDIEFTYAAN